MQLGDMMCLIQRLERNKIAKFLVGLQFTVNCKL